MKLVRVMSFALLASFLVLGGCSSGQRGQSKASRQAVRNESGSLRIPYDQPRSASRLTLSLSLRASAGSFVYTLVNPQGDPEWQGWVNAGQTLNESRPLKPMAGKWVLTLVMQGVTGSYDVVWESR